MAIRRNPATNYTGQPAGSRQCLVVSHAVRAVGQCNRRYPERNVVKYSSALAVTEPLADFAASYQHFAIWQQGRRVPLACHVQITGGCPLPGGWIIQFRASKVVVAVKL